MIVVTYIRWFVSNASMFNWNQSLGRIDKTNNQPSHDARFRHTENVFGNVHTHDDVVDDVHLSLSLSLSYIQIYYAPFMR